MEILVHSVLYKEKREDEFKRGVKIGEDGMIVDLEGNTVKEVWDYHSLFSEGCFKIY